MTAAGFVPAIPGSRYDVAVVLTDHDVLDLADIAEQADLVFDARAAYRRRAIDADNVVVM